MTDNKNRGKLTLKLKLPGAADPKALALKSAEKKRISNSMVQVAIKGRRNSQNSDNNLDSKTLNTKRNNLYLTG